MEENTAKRKAVAPAEGRSQKLLNKIRMTMMIQMIVMVLSMLMMSMLFIMLLSGVSVGF